MSKNKHKQNGAAKPASSLKGNKARRNLFFMSLTFLVAKLILIFTIQDGGWLGADGENYLNAMNGLLKDGIFSNAHLLSYWPAGYSIILWGLSKISLAHLLTVISVFQTVIYFIGCAYFVEKLRQTRLTRLAVPVAFLLAINPTLSLSSLAVGYESPMASLMILSIGLIIHTEINPSKKTLWKTLPLVAGLQGLSAFMQPRGLLISFFMFLIWALRLSSRKQGALLLIVGMAIVMVLPAGEIVRNVKANDFVSISTNLGTTMFIGIGDGATGGYNGKYNGVPCPAAEKGTEAKIDSAKVKCAVIWYLKNPGKTLVLAFKKSEFFWSPWSGPLGNGTMARNPWLKIDPIVNIAKGSKQGYDLVYGPFGKIVSWLWLLGGLALLFAGFFGMFKMGGTERLLGLLTGVPVLLGWLTSIGTIGDHRFRIPTMTASLFLQVAGFVALKRGKFKKITGLSALEPRGRAR